MTFAGLKYYLKKPRLWYSFFSSRGLLNWMPDSMYLRMVYRMKMKKKLHLNKPKSFNEKLQWLKLNDRQRVYSDLVDKYEVKDIIAEKIDGNIVVPTIGIWNKFDDIDFESLPDKYVLKCTHDSGGLVICRNKKELNIVDARKKIEESLNTNFYMLGREWPYKNVIPRIIAEEYIDEGNDSGLTDYKFFFFNNEAKLLYISRGLEDHTTAQISFFDMNGGLLPFHRKDFSPFSENVVLPSNFEEMKIIARRIALMVSAPFLRVDLYSVNGKIYFSEITFSPCSGMIPFEPDEWDLILGEWLELPNEKHR